MELTSAKVINKSLLNSRQMEENEYSSVNVAGRIADGSAERRTALVRDISTSSSSSAVIVAENTMVCLLLGPKQTWGVNHK